MAGQSHPITTIEYEAEQFTFPGLSILALTQTSDGFFWGSGYPNGILRWRGGQADYFPSDSVLNGNADQLVEDDLGYLWLGQLNGRGKDGGVSVSSAPVLGGDLPDHLHWRDRVGETMLSHGEVHDLNMDGAGQIWAAVDSALLVYRWTDPHTLETVPITLPGKEALPGQVLTVLPVPDGSVWISFAELPEVYRLHLAPDAREVTVVDRRTLPPGPPAYLWVADADEALWGIRENVSAFRLNLADDALLEKPLDTATDHLRRLDDSTILVPTKGAGLLLWDDRTGEERGRFGSAQGLSTSTLFDAVADDQGNIWLASIEGLHRLPADFTAFTFYTDTPLADQPPLLANASINGINAAVQLQTPDGGPISVILAGVIDGLLVVPAGDAAPFTVGPGEGLPINTVMGIAQDRSGGIYLTSLRGGLAYLRKGGTPHPAATKTVELPALAAGYVADFIPSRRLFIPYVVELAGEPESTVWAGQGNSIYVFSRERAHGLEIHFGSDYAGRDPIASFRDSAGYVHLVNGGGWYRTRAPFTFGDYLAAASPGNFNEAEGTFILPDTLVRRQAIEYAGEVFANPRSSAMMDGRLYLGFDSLLLVADPLTGRVLGRVDFLGSLARCTAIADGGALVWAGTGAGLYGIRKSDLRIVHRLLQKDGSLASNNWSPSGLDVTPRGQVAQGLSAGLQLIDTARLQSDDYARPVYVTDLAYEENGWGDNELAVAYTMLSFREKGEHVVYQTRLEGFEDEFTDWTSETAVRYTNLRAFLFPKTFRLRVRARDYRGQIFATPDEAYALTVAPPYYTRWWAIVIYVVLAWVAIRGYTRFRLRQLERNHRLQEAATIRLQRDEIVAKNAENETLLKEIHHRVKNNLEVVSSLLELQSESLEEGSARDAMLAGQSRVASMGLLHQKLYQGEDLASVNMRDYLGDLTDTIAETYEVDQDILISVRAPDDLSLDVDTAVPVGLIVNELVTNALKYAFRGAEAQEKSHATGPNRITVVLEPLGEKLRLSVRDNGAGKQQGPAAGTGFGTRLVHLLARQLDGRLQEHSGAGLDTQVVF